MPTWMTALKEWNAKSGTWCVPRKGSLAYAEVLKLMHPEAEGLVKKMKQEIEIKHENNQICEIVNLNRKLSQ